MPVCRAALGSCGLIGRIIYLNGRNGRELVRSLRIWPLQPFLVDLQHVVRYGRERLQRGATSSVWPMVGRCEAPSSAPCWTNGIGKTWRRKACLPRHPRGHIGRSVPCHGRSEVFPKWGIDFSHGNRTLLNPEQPWSPHRPLRAELTSDEGFDHVDGSVRLRTRLDNPAVLGTRKDLVVDLAARCPVCCDEVLLHCREHVVIQFTL
jgi:hypothetical protein